MRASGVIALLGLLSVGCAAQARTPPVYQPLDVPPVPARVIVPEIEEEVELPAPVDPGAAARPPATRTDPPSKPPDKPPEPPKTEDPPRVRTPQTANDEQAERLVRSVMGRAQSTLNTVNYQTLSNAAKQQYDMAKRFIARADGALRIRNYVFARNLADKAETLARQLGK
ncbi:MAG: hypothetical protein WD690_07460 [Vicinamibacterales bacterium]